MASPSHGLIRKRVIYVFLIVTFVITGLIFRLAYLQCFKSSWLAENALDQRIRDIPVEAKRGIIYDRNGKELAISVSTESIYAIPAEIKDAEDTAAKLAAVFMSEPDSIKKVIKKRQAFTWVKRKVDQETARQVVALNLPGIGITQESQRVYPFEQVASHVLGFTGIDSQGLDGVEMTFDTYLRGRPGSIRIEYDARGREIPYANHHYIPPVDGNHVYLTIDVVIQQIVERELDRVLKETQAKGVTIVAMDPQSGEILALANKPDYNPNRFGEFSPKLWRNPAISNAYEPGSTFKVITTASVLSQQVLRPNENFFDPGYIEVQGRNIHCWKHGGHGSQTFEQVVMNSCNVGFVTVGLRLGRDPFYDYLENFGFGKHTGIDLPGEAKGIMIQRDKVKPINLATMAMGQSIAVTPIQLVTAVSAVANDGSLVRPQIVREVKDSKGEIIRGFQRDVVKNVIKPEISAQVRGILEKVVEEGTGKNAYLEGFHIGGKTGTAQKVGSSGYLPDKYVASFIGLAPADQPKLVMLIIIDEPVGLYYGGQVAAPVFSAVMKDVLPYLSVQEEVKSEGQGQASHVEVPNVINLTLIEANQALQLKGLKGRGEESGLKVLHQIPRPGSRVPVGSTVLLLTQSVEIPGMSEVTVPDLSGQSLSEIRARLNELGLSYSIQNEQQGKVLKQDPLPGQKVPLGTTILLYFE